MTRQKKMWLKNVCGAITYFMETNFCCRLNVYYNGKIEYFLMINLNPLVP